MARQSTPTDKEFIVPLENYDTETATPEQCAVHSGFDYPKTREENEKFVEVEITAPFDEGRTNILTVNFDDKEYKHCHVAWVELSPIMYVRPGTYGLLPVFFGDNPFWMESYTTPDSKLKIDFINYTGGSLDLGSFTFQFKYQIWDNEVNA